MLRKTVAVVDMAGYSDIARLLEQNISAASVSELNRQIQAFITRSLERLSASQPYVTVARTGDGIILLFDSADAAHTFAANVHRFAKEHNERRTESTAQRWFRVGVATGDVSTTANAESSREHAGITIADAVRLEAAAEAGEILMDAASYADLSQDFRRLYGPEEIVRGKREESFRARRCVVAHCALTGDFASAHRDLPGPYLSSAVAYQHSPVGEIVAALRGIEALDGLSGEEYLWLARNGIEIKVEPGALLFREGDPPASMNILLRGEIHLRRADTGDVPYFIARTGQIAGLMPFSRMQGYGGTGYAVGEAWALDISKDKFPEMLAAIPSMAQRCVGAMLNRTREVTRRPPAHQPLSQQLPFEPYRGNDPYIFASHSDKDSHLVFPELGMLHDRGFRIWYDEGVAFGGEWPEHVATALDRATVFLVFISPSAVDSANVRNEINFALNRGKRFLAVYIEETTLPAGLELRMGSIQAIMKWRMTDANYERMIASALPAAVADPSSPAGV